MKNRRVRTVALLPEHDSYLTGLAEREYDGNLSAALRAAIKGYIVARGAGFFDAQDMPKRRIVDAVSA